MQISAIAKIQVKNKTGITRITDIPLSAQLDAASIIPPFKPILFRVYRKYQMQINKDTIVDKGGANPMTNSEELSIRLNQYDSGMRNKKVAIRLCIIGNNEFPCPLK